MQVPALNEEGGCDCCNEQQPYQRELLLQAGIPMSGMQEQACICLLEKPESLLGVSPLKHCLGCSENSDENSLLLNRRQMLSSR